LRLFHTVSEGKFSEVSPNIGRQIVHMTHTLELSQLASCSYGGKWMTRFS
jgi:hypothetical protein